VRGLFLLIEKPCMNPEWPRKLYRAARRLFGGGKGQAEVIQDADLTF
jgi:hypothetical protein